MHNTKKYLDAICTALFFEWDPIGISSESGAAGEYDAYAGEVYSLLVRRASPDEIFNYLWQIETLHMGLHGDRQQTEAFAQRLLSLIDEVDADSK